MITLPPTLRTLSGHLRSLTEDRFGRYVIATPSGRALTLEPDPCIPGAWRVVAADGQRPPSELRAVFSRHGQIFHPVTLSDVREAWRPVRRAVTIDGRPHTVRVSPDGVELRPKGARAGALSLPWTTILACAERHAAAPIPAAPKRRGRG